ncbi:MAG: hypothetical protein AABZ30_15140 [Myxococcota bacterium]
MSRLGSLLVQDGVVTVKAIEEAFQRQVLFGGELDTILLEMGVVDEGLLLEYLSRSAGLPPGGLALVEASAESFPGIPADVAIAARVAPASVRAGTLIVLVTDPPDRKRLDELAFRLGMEVSPRVVPEVTFHLALERVYGMAPPARLEPLAAPRRAAAPPLPANAPAVETAPSARPAALQASPDDTEDETRFALDAQPFDATPLDRTQATALLLSAGERDAVLEAYVRDLARRASFAAVFVLQGARALGRVCVRGPFADREIITRADIPLDQPSIFQRCVESKRPVLGPVLDEGINYRILTDLPRAVPVAALVVPVVIRGKVVCLGYLDNAVKPLSETCVREAIEVSSLVGDALLRLIAKAKSAASLAVAPSAAPAPAPTPAPPPAPPPAPAPAPPPHPRRTTPPPVPLKARRTPWGAADSRRTPAMWSVATAIDFGAIERALFDPNLELRQDAARAFEAAASRPEAPHVMNRLRAEIASPDLVRRRCAAEALGALRDAAAVARLVALLDDVEPVAAVAEAALRDITKESLGRRKDLWRLWLDRHHGTHRIQWLISGLMRDDDQLRRAAAEELARSTGEDFGYHHGAPEAEREEAQERWQTWWQSTGRNRFTT